MFVIRAVCGEHKGKYYLEFDADSHSCLWADSPEAARHVSGADAAGYIMAMIDKPRIVAVPEMLPSATDADCDLFADFAANGMFSNKTGVMTKIIRGLIRKSPNDLIHDQPEGLPRAESDYMSVWEWLTRSMAASVKTA